MADRVISDKVTQASMSGMKKLSMSVAADFNTESYSIYSNSPLPNFNDKEIKTSLDPTKGKQCNSFGDLIVMF